MVDTPVYGLFSADLRLRMHIILAGIAIITIITIITRGTMIANTILPDAIVLPRNENKRVSFSDIQNATDGDSDSDDFLDYGMI